jgi:hypothetical protein
VRASSSSLVLLFLLGCGEDKAETTAGEGTAAGDCTDGADNDADGSFDCDDEGCAGSPDCADSGSDTNAAPSGAAVAIEPVTPADEDDLRCVVVTPATDPNGDSVTYRYAWAKNGADVGLTSETVAAALTTGGDTWTCTVTPTDGTLDGVTASATVSIAQGNRAPGAPTVSITPSAPTDEDVLTCVIDTESVDPDGDAVTYSYAWSVDGADSGITGASVNSSLTEAGQRWTCAVTASDGELSSGTASVSVEVASSCSYALHFDGIDDYALAADPGGLAPTSVTVSAWVRMDVPEWHVAWSKKSSSLSGWWMYGAMLSPSQYYFKAQNEFFVSDSVSFTEVEGEWDAGVGVWNHVAQVYDALTGDHDVYLNGALVDSRSHGSGLYNPGGTDELCLGCDSGDPGGRGGYFNGALDDMRIYSVALTASQVADIASSGAVPSAGLLAHWTFDDGGGSTAADASGNGHDLTLNGATFELICP